MADRPDTEAAFEAALSAHEARHSEQALRLCENILRTDPDHAEALNLLGVILQDRGRAEESIPLLTRAVQADPGFPDAFANLARGYRLLDQKEAAADAARKAVELDPSLGQGWLQLGFSLAALGREEDGLTALREAAVRIPDDLELQTCLGLAARAAKQHDVAEQAWAAVAKMQPDRIDALVNRGTALSELGRLDEAMIPLRRAVDLAPDDIPALEALALVLQRRFDGRELISVCRRILARHPERLDILGALSNGLVWTGQFDELEKTRAAVLAVQPDNRSFARQVGAMVPGFLDRTDIEHCEAQLREPETDAGERIGAGFALAKALDARGDHDAAFAAYSAANALIRAEDAAANRRFRVEELQTYVANMRSQFTSSTFAAFARFGNDSELPVFIVGMPRSGTSLVEQIAASHPRVFGAGEQKDMMELVTRLNRGQGFLPPTRWDPEQIGPETAAHVERLRAIGGDADRVIDKLPDNIQLLGHIRILFPRARIIICRRDLRDVCVSCFTTRFGDPMPWSYDLEQCAERAVEIERLTRHWRLVLPGPVMEVHYETLVANLETESRRLIEFLGLDWDSSCLEFHKTDRTVTTSSAWQVRQPLYDSSVGRWRRYRRHLDPMLRVLAGYVPDETDSAVARS